MTRFLKLLSVVLAGVALVYAGFYLTGLLAVHMEPKSFGLTARTIFVLIMFLAWVSRQQPFGWQRVSLFAGILCDGQPLAHWRKYAFSWPSAFIRQISTLRNQH